MKHFLLIEAADSPGQIYWYQAKKLILKTDLEIDNNFGQKLLTAIEEDLNSLKLDYQQLSGVGVLAGPGRFSPLRVAHIVANTLSYSQNLAVANATGEDWREVCLKELESGQRKIIKPIYPSSQFRRHKEA